MKIWTSYFAKIDKLRQLGYNDFVAISGYVPEFYQNAMNMTDNSCNKSVTFRRMIEFAPKKEWFFDWKNGKFDNNEYIRLYNETVLNKIDKAKIIKELKDNTILLCYEKPNEFCHRHLVSEWLRNEMNIECQEIETEERIF